MGRGRSRGPLGTSRGTLVALLSPLAPLTAVVLCAVSASAAALHLHAGVLRAGPWAWVGDAALGLDVCGALALLGVPAAIRREQGTRSGMADVDVMPGSAFEERLAGLFVELGYAVTRTRASGDFGADLLLERDGERVVVQAKRYDGAVGIDAVQQVIGATRYYDAARAVVVTNSTCTSAAVALAGAHGVELVERESLAGLLAARPLAGARSSPVLLLAYELAGGLALVLFVAGAILRTARWGLRAALRLLAWLLRAAR